MPELESLCSWFTRHDDTVVAVDGDNVFSCRDLIQRADLWRKTLSKTPATRVAVFHHDALEFAAIVYALWSLHRVACVPGDNLPGTVELLKKHVDSFAGEFGCLDAINIGDPHFTPESNHWSPLDENGAALEIYTSGSTGKPKAIIKSIGQLQRELEALEALWPSKSGEVVLGTVSHQHIYGMTFRIFWPLVTRRPFLRCVCEYTEDLYHYGKHHTHFSIVSSPSHLGRMSPSIDWSQLQRRCRSVTSSAAPLKRDDALHVSSLLQCEVREIYGSSETGAIAWRQQRGDQKGFWRGLPGVVVSVADNEQTLRVRCNYIGGDGEYDLPDRIALQSDTEFKLLGRADRIVKVEGKRLSLTAIETRLQEHRCIKNCKALVVEKKRVETAVVFELSNAGVTTLLKLGYRALIGELRSWLSGHFEPVALPRRWRLVAEMPFNSQGKLPLGNLQKLFEPDEIEQPVTVGRTVDGKSADLTLYFPPNLVYFNGHFDKAAILPGVAQVHMAVQFAQELFLICGTFKALEVVKFQQVIPSRHTVKLALRHDSIKNKLYFEFASNRGVHSSGRICFT